MKYFSSGRESGEVLMSFAKMGEHVGPGLVSSWFARPDAHVMVKDRLFHEECISQIQLVLGGQRGLGVFREFFEIFDGIEDIVNRHSNTIAHVAKSLFLGND